MSSETVESAPDIQQIETAIRALELGGTDDAQGKEPISLLASASKSNDEVRKRLARPETLSKLISIVECGLSDSLEATSLALRCIGNACIDNDDARDAVTSLGFSWAKQCLISDDEEIKWLAVKVLYNICSEHEGAQQRCYHETVHYDLISICASPIALRSQDRSLLIDLLFWITGQKVAAANAPLAYDQDANLPDDVLLKLLNLPYYYAATADLEDFATLIEILLTFLRDSVVQSHVVDTKRVGYVWQAHETCTDTIKRSAMLGGEQAETKKLLKPLAASLMWCLSDIAANPGFGVRYTLDAPFIDSLVMILRSDGEETGVMPEDVFEQEALGVRLFQEARLAREEPIYEEVGYGGDQSVAAACQIVGNLLFQLPPAAIVPLVKDQKIHEKLWRFFLIREDRSDHDTTHSVASFMIQLTRGGTEVCEILGEDENAQSAMTELCEHQTPQIKQDGIKLLRALGRDCAANRERFARLAASLTFSSDGDTPMFNGTNGMA